MTKKLYVSDWCKKMEYTPNDNYDPRYYFVDSEDIAAIREYFSDDEYDIDGYEEVLFAPGYELQKFMQDDMGMNPMWFDVCGEDIPVADELASNGYEW